MTYNVFIIVSVLCTRRSDAISFLTVLKIASSLRSSQ